MCTAIVHIIDDDHSVREALADLLASVGLQTMRHESANAFLSSSRPECPSCIILDVRMPGYSGLELQSILNKDSYSIPIIFITAHGDIPMSVRALKAGAIEFLTKPIAGQALIDAAHDGLNRDRENRYARTQKQIILEKINSLSVGEKTVLDYVVAGFMNKQIASELCLSEITIKVRRASVMRKMHVSSLAELVRLVSSVQNLL